MGEFFMWVMGTLIATGVSFALWVLITNGIGALV